MTMKEITAEEPDCYPYGAYPPPGRSSGVLLIETTNGIKAHKFE